MNALKRIAVLAGRIWAPVLILLIVLACGLVAKATADQPETHMALSAALATGPMF